MKAWEIAGYTYKAQCLCGECLVKALPTGEGEEFDGWALADGYWMPVEDNLNEIAQAFGIDRQDEHTFDSDDFPKVIFASMVEGETCDGCGVNL